MKAMRLLKRGAAVTVGLFLFYYLFIPRPHYQLGNWGRIFDWEKHYYSFCTYTVPSNYKYASYENNDDYTNEAVFYKDTVHQRYLILIKFEDFPSGADMRTIQVKPEMALRSVNYEYLLLPEIEVRMSYYLLWRDIPGLFVSDFDRLGDKLLLRGIRVQGRGDLTTEAAQILYFVGPFERLGFYRQWRKWGGYPVPVLDFLKPRYGGVAVIHSRKSSETIFAILSAPDKAHFDESDFRQILDSVTFEKKTTGTKEWLLDMKRRGQIYRRETGQWGPLKWQRQTVGHGDRSDKPLTK